MEPFVKLSAVAAPLDMTNVDTDKIIPGRFLRKLRGPGYDKLAFHDIRFNADGSENPDFVLNKAPYRQAKILAAAANFGCGSSREAAVYVLYDFGIRCVIASSFGDIHYGNELQNGMLPVILPDAACATLRAQLHANPGATVAVDLEAQKVTGPDGTVYVGTEGGLRVPFVVRGPGIAAGVWPTAEAFLAAHRYHRFTPGDGAPMAQQAIEVVGSLFGAFVRADMSGDQTVPNRQQIHTHTCSRVRFNVVASPARKKGGKPLHHSKMPQEASEGLQLFHGIG